MILFIEKIEKKKLGKILDKIEKQDNELSCFAVIWLVAIGTIFFEGTS